MPELGAFGSMGGRPVMGVPLLILQHFRSFRLSQRTELELSAISSRVGEARHSGYSAALSMLNRKLRERIA